MRILKTTMFFEDIADPVLSPPGFFFRE